MGFVAFMDRRDAEHALAGSEGVDWGGNVLRVGWGKTVSLPGFPVYASARDGQASGSRARSRSPAESSSKRARRSRSPSSPPPAPSDSELTKFIRVVAARCDSLGIVRGKEFVEMLKVKEAGNDKFAFLSDQSVSHGDVTPARATADCDAHKFFSLRLSTSSSAFWIQNIKRPHRLFQMK